MSDEVPCGPRPCSRTPKGPADEPRSWRKDEYTTDAGRACPRRAGAWRAVGARGRVGWPLERARTPTMTNGTRDVRGMRATSAACERENRVQIGHFCSRCGICTGSKEAEGRLRLTWQRKGATGLESATSGVTGRFGDPDDLRRWTRSPSIHAAFGRFRDLVPHG